MAIVSDILCRDAAIGRDRQVPAHLVMHMLIVSVA